MKDFIKHSNEKILKEWKEWFLFKKIPIIIIKSFNSNIQIPKIISLIENNLKTKKYVFYLEGIYIGEFPELKDRKIQAMFKDGVIFVSNFVNNPNITEDRIAKDIIHEVGHSLEDVFGAELYADSDVVQEFIGKRARLYSLLSYDGIQIPKKLFLNNTDYSPEIDKILYKDVGYAKLNPEIIGLFLSPYCVTSLSEYFANGFEEYHTGDINFLKNICPVLYNKLEILENIIKES